MKALMIGVGATAMLLSAIAAQAGPVRDFEADLRKTYSDYRVALFATNSGKADQAAAAIGRFADGWKALGAEPVPPHYADDEAFANTLVVVAEITAAADAEVRAGKLAEAHETLEGIRDAIAALHERNGVIGFSDRMNAYHAKMEAVIAMDAADIAGVRESLAVLDYLHADIAAHRPDDADAAFDEMLGGVAASLAKLRTAVEAGDAAATKAAIDGLKAPYSKLFLNFG